jgi:hypothetical protein
MDAVCILEGTVNELAKLLAWFWEHYPAEDGWSIQTSIGEDNTILVAIKHHEQTLFAHQYTVKAGDKLFERQEQAVQYTIEQLKEKPNK